MINKVIIHKYRNPLNAKKNLTLFAISSDWDYIAKVKSWKYYHTNEKINCCGRH